MQSTRSFSRVQWLFVALICVLHSALGLPISNQQGTTIEVDVLQIEDQRIRIRLDNGSELWLERERLSTESEQAIRQLETRQGTRFEGINQLLGIQLLKDNQLWDDSAHEVAQRLRWPLESKTKTESSFRYYPPANERILGARPYSAALYGDSAQTFQLSLVFANKGDFAFRDAGSKSQIKALHAAIQHDAATLSAHISKMLGKPHTQQFGSDRGLKERIRRWDWQGHALLLAHKAGEYVSLRIVPVEIANNKGRGQRFSDAALRQRTQQNIQTCSNGDVVIDNIPMVHQGPKGYCVPATFERYLRYMQIPADMYLLAMAGQTNIGGGTALSQIIDAVDRYIGSHNRRLQRLQQPITIRNVRKYIDQGLPLIWTMFSSEAYNQYANQRTQQRQTVLNWAAWAKATKTSARSTVLGRDRMRAHACLITGYNKATGEIAVSDSWGPAYNQRWISATQAEQVSQGSLYLINF